MKPISLKVDEATLAEAEQYVKLRGISRNQYINEAIQSYNKVCRRKKLAEEFAKASKLVSENSMEVLQDLENLEEGLTDD